MICSLSRGVRSSGGVLEAGIEVSADLSPGVARASRLSASSRTFGNLLASSASCSTTFVSPLVCPLFARLALPSHPFRQPPTSHSVFSLFPLHLLQFPTLLLHHLARIAVHVSTSISTGCIPYRSGRARHAASMPSRGCKVHRVGSGARRGE